MLLVEFLKIDILVLVSRDSSNGCISRFLFTPRYGGDISLCEFMHISKHYRSGKWHLLLVFRASNSRRQTLVMRFGHVWIGSEVEVYTSGTKDQSSWRAVWQKDASADMAGIVQCPCMWEGEATEYDQLAVASETLKDLCILSLISLPTIFQPPHLRAYNTRSMHTMW
jgi:hypothetical protein